MDAVAELQTQAERSLKGWLTDGEKLIKTASTAGVDIEPLLKGSRVVATITGSLSGGWSGRTARASRSRRRTRRSATSRAPNGHAGVTGEQIITFLQTEGPANQATIAAHFGTTPQTIKRHLAALGDQVYMEPGDGGQKRWHARELQPA